MAAVICQPFLQPAARESTPGHRGSCVCKRFHMVNQGRERERGLVTIEKAVPGHPDPTELVLEHRSVSKTSLSWVLADASGYEVLGTVVSWRILNTPSVFTPKYLMT